MLPEGRSGALLGAGGAGRAGERDGLAGRDAPALAEGGGGFPPRLPPWQLRFRNEEEGARAARQLLLVVGTCRM